MNQKSIAIIGAGIAGLSAGCYARMNGYDATIYEMHNLPGGVCTSWKRQGYTIDGCIGWLLGSSPSSSYYRIYEELGAVQGRTFINHDEFLRVHDENGQELVLYTDPDKLEAHLKQLSPADAPVIDEFMAALRVCARFNPDVEKAPELMSPLDGLKFLSQNGAFLKVNAAWKDVTMADFAARFSSPFLRRAFPLAFSDPFALIMTLGWLSQKAAGFPLGGSLEFARAIERRFLALGGQIHYGARVEQILVEGGRACGLRLVDGSRQPADIVISAADGHATLFDLLQGEYLNDDLRRYYKDFSLYDPLVYVTLGVARSFAGLPHWVVYPLPEAPDLPVIGGQAQPSLGVEIYNFDPSLAPIGKTLIKCMFPCDYDYWKNLSADPARYQAEKDNIADWVIAQLDQHYPGLAAQVDMRDVATPLTWERYTANWRGSFEGWKMTKENTPPFRMPRTLPGLRNFYMAGQWVEVGGGIPAVAVSARNLLQIICKADGRKFTAFLP
ncbi:MAG: NAD(P)/FAD-dependent oxidoreductase [Anaerolineae bacterium]|nr:NAD(P)/FAD-dependent oxidoreductase [Anaerolineae bacterium]